MSAIRGGGAVVLGVDIGTTGVKVLAVDVGARELIASSVAEYPSKAVPGGGHEQDPADWWSAVSRSCREALLHTGGRRVAAVGLSGHMHSLLLLDERLRPIRPAMTWADRRVGRQAARLAAGGLFRAAAGNDLNEAFTAPKLAWIAETEPDSLRRARHLLSAKDYIGLLLTGTLATDVTDAMGTLLWNLHTRQWDSELFAACGATPALGPEVLPSGALRGAVTPSGASATGIPAGTPVIAGAGDVSAAVLGTGVVDASAIALNAGTAAQIMGLSATPDAGPGFLFGDATGAGYVCMASVYAAGASIRWAERSLFGDRPIGTLADDAPPGADGLSYLPFMYGSTVPRKNDAARAAFAGQAELHAPAHLAAAVLEGVAFACADAVEAVAAVAGAPDRVHVVGGVTASVRWCAALAAVLDADVVRLPGAGSALGAVILAVAAAGERPLEAADLVGHEQVARPSAEDVQRYRDARARFQAWCELLV